MSKKSTVKDREAFVLGGKLSELDWEPKTEAQISKDLFKGTDPEKMVDSFEEQLGLKHKKFDLPKQVYKCMPLKPFDDEDRTLLQKFYNNPEQYQVIHRSDNWNMKGELTIFLEYFENMDFKEKQEAKLPQPEL